MNKRKNLSQPVNNWCGQINLHVQWRGPGLTGGAGRGANCVPRSRPGPGRGDKSSPRPAPLRTLDDTVCAIAERNGKLYFLNARDRSRDHASNASDDSLEWWHNRLEHVDLSTIPKLSVMVIWMLTIKGDPDRERCKRCLLGKMTLPPFQDATNKTTTPL